ncbi:TPA_asm: M [Phellodendron betacytorhabdovirus 1]|nr:TPA_asm: M [Phellodendron betacytorhabdovirus 1]
MALEEIKSQLDGSIGSSKNSHQIVPKKDTAPNKDKVVGKTNLSTISVPGNTEINGSTLAIREVSAKRKSKFLIIPAKEIKINYCGMFSDFKCQITGKSQEELVMNYKDILYESIKSHILENGDDSTDLSCEVSIICEMLSSYMGRKQVNEIIKPVATDFLLGANVYKMNIEFPSNKISRVKYGIRFDTNRNLNFELNLAEGGKFKYVIRGSGNVMLWRVSDQVVKDSYRTNNKNLIPGTIMNEPPDNYRTLQIHHYESDEKETISPTLSGLPSEQKIVSDLFSGKAIKKREIGN